MESDNGAGMTLDAFEAGLDRWGADLARWPQEMRDVAHSFLGQSEDAQALMRDALALDAVLDEAPTGEVHAALAARVMAGVPGTDGARGPGIWLRSALGVLWPDFGWVRPTALMAVSLIAGLLAGLTAPAMTAETEQNDLFAYVFAAPDTWIDEPGNTTGTGEAQ